VLGLPSPDQLGSAAANLYDAALRGGVADLRRMPAQVIDRGRQRTVSRYLPVEGARQRTGAPVLLVPPLAAPAICFDLRRGCSLAEHLLRTGRRSYLVDYGAIQFADRDLGIEHWVHEAIPAAVRAVAHDAGDRPVKIVGWCLGGIMSVLAHAADAEVPIESIALVASPWDVSKVPLVAPLRPIDAMTRGWAITQLYRALGGAPAPLVKRGYQLAGFDKYVLKPWTIASNLDDRELLAQIEAVDAFMDRMHAYPGRTFGQLYHRFLRTNDLATGRLELGGQHIDVADSTVPMLAVAGRGDGIAPVAACHHLADLVPKVRKLRLETAPGGHLGVLTGRAARGTTWRILDEWLDLPSRRRRARRVASSRAA
jgi:polyhydroxyalkanoate synthase subunit PhaC